MGKVASFNESLGKEAQVQPDQPTASRPTAGSVPVESNQRYYLRRASEERTAALRSITQQARDWHLKLAGEFAERARAVGAATPMPFATPMAMSA